MAAADVGLQGIGDSVYENMVCRYRTCVEVAGPHIEPFLKVDPEKQRSVNNKWESSICDVVVF